jgi:hypothetical protein
MHRYLENPAFGRALEKEVPCDEMDFFDISHLLAI